MRRKTTKMKKKKGRASRKVADENNDLLVYKRARSRMAYLVDPSAV